MKLTLLKALTLTLLMVCTVTAAAAQKLTLAGWGGTDKAIIHGLLSEVLREDLRALNVEVEYLPIESNFGQYLMNSLSSGTAPDIFYVDVNSVDVLAGSGKLQPQSAAELQATMLPVLVESFEVQKTSFALPKDFNAYAVVYNRDVFVDAGVDIPHAQDTWSTLKEKLRQVVVALGDEGVYGACLKAGYTGGFSPLLLSTGWEPIGADGRTRLDDRFEQAFRFYISLFHDNIAILASELGHSWSGGCFGTERTAIAIEGNWLAGYLRDKAPNLLYGAVPTPLNAATGSAGNLLLSVGWGLNRDSKNMRLAQSVLELLTSEKAQRWILASGLALPSRRSMAQAVESATGRDAEAQLANAIYAGVNRGYVRPYSFGAYGDAWTDPINEALSAVLVGGVEVDAALKVAQQRFDDMYQRFQERLQ
ncbi:extracellular solute-binding protein [Pseudomaricurvus alkylphenolicus]|uniref:extracellular solute-binding protein n=1 Tax=Pseudomaricurvus alkylphenolicus TaxID=1306991 RepID=UPI00141E47AB|nr:extracellular solute-binding protein [Pseudomaricurvus alkylphenolicus]NIB42381.1 extracellular solute-binding protein [Pseudomaricurvus alkylphenolicus]